MNGKEHAFQLCRIGEYRQAALLALRSRKDTPLQPFAVECALPLALVKCGRFHAALKATTRLAKLFDQNNHDIASLISLALRHIQITKQHLDALIKWQSRFKLDINAAGLVAASIADRGIRSEFIAAVSKTNNFLAHDIYVVQSIVERQLGNNYEAIKLLQEASKCCEITREIALLSAEILNTSGEFYFARKYVCFGLKKNQKDLVALDLLGRILFQESRWKAAQKIYRLMHLATGDDISLLNMNFTLPQLALSSAELSNALSVFSKGIDLCASSEKFKGIEFSLQVCSPLCHSFYLAYQGSIDLKDYLEDYYSVIRKVVESLLAANQIAHSALTSQSKKQLSVNSRDARIRIGFISRNFNQHSNFQAHIGLIKYLDRSRFHVTIIHRPGCIKDTAHHIVNSVSDHILYLNADFGENCKQIAGLHLDILFFTDIGMYPLDGVLAMVRLAPVQVTGWGIPHTSGLTEVDYYLRSAIFSDCEHESSYSEKLISLDGYLGYFSIDKEQDFPDYPSDYFMLPPDRLLIGCLQSLHKIHPDFDEYLESIARLDRSILIVVAASENDALNRRFTRRLRASAPTAHNQICFLRKMSMADYYSLNKLLDLNLDTLHYGAGITFIQSTWCGPPCVTQRGGTVRSAVVSRSYEYMGIKGAPIARNIDEYIEWVHFLISHPIERLRLKNEIHQKCSDLIYNNETYLRSCEEFFHAAVHCR